MAWWDQAVRVYSELFDFFQRHYSDPDKFCYWTSGEIRTKFSKALPKYETAKQCWIKVRILKNGLIWRNGVFTHRKTQSLTCFVWQKCRKMLRFFFISKPLVTECVACTKSSHCSCDSGSLLVKNEYETVGILSFFYARCIEELTRPSVYMRRKCRIIKCQMVDYSAKCF